MESIYDIIVNTVMMNITSSEKFYWMLMASDPGLNGLYSIRMEKYEMGDLNERQLWIFQCLKRLHRLGEAKRIIREGGLIAIACWRFPVGLVSCS